MFDFFIKGIQKKLQLLYLIKFFCKKEKQSVLKWVFFKMKLSELPEASPFRSPLGLHAGQTRKQEFTAPPDPHMKLLHL